MNITQTHIIHTYNNKVYKYTDIHAYNNKVYKYKDINL